MSVGSYEGMKRLSEEFNRLAEMIDRMKKVDLLLLDFIEEKGLKDEFNEWVKSRPEVLKFLRKG